MTAQLFWNSLAAVVAWFIVVNRLVSVLRRQPHLSPTAKRQVWLFWGAFFGFAIAVTIYQPFVQKLLNASGWLHDVPQTVLAIVVYVIGAHICYSFAPAVCPRRNWPLYVGAGAIVVYLFVAWATKSWPIVSPLLSSRGAVPRLVFNAFLLVILGRIVLPAYVWAWRHEQQRPMRLRLQSIAGMHGFVVVWLLIGTGDAAASTFGIALDLTPVYVTLGVFITLLFAAHFAPPSFFVDLAQRLDYPDEVLTYLDIRKVQVRAARLVNWRLIRLGWQDVLRDPAKAVYRSVVAIFDMRKLLKQCDHPDAQALSRQLDAVAKPDLEYDDIVRRLREIGR
jgi:hypothetical protein